jgi:hypothetical protein
MATLRGGKNRTLALQISSLVLGNINLQLLQNRPFLLPFTAPQV